KLTDADLVFTGEGRLDSQSLYGKTTVGVARLAKRHGVPIVALAGSLGEGHEALYGEGIDAALSITDEPMTLEEASAEAERLIANAAERALRLMAVGAKLRDKGLELRLDVDL
ncbi:MAG: glycerate kinase, partial [Chloroflexi bacterium]|nr:glycerate kinase [Chloroflexota bacterium]